MQKTGRACSFRFAVVAPSRLTYQKTKTDHPQKIKKTTKVALGLFPVKVFWPFEFARQKSPPPGKMSLCPIFSKKGAVVFFPALFYFGVIRLFHGLSFTSLFSYLCIKPQESLVFKTCNL